MPTSSSHSYFSTTMSSSSSSSSSRPSYTPSSERTSGGEQDPYDGPRIPPTVVPPQPTPIVIQPNHRGPRTRLTARKSVPIPRRVCFRSDQREAPEPSRVIEGVPISRAPGMTWAEEQHLRAVTAELHGCQMRVSRQSQVTTELVELSHLLTNMSSDALSGARIARRIALRAEIVCIVVVMLLTLMVAWIMFEVNRGGY